MPAGQIGLVSDAPFAVVGTRPVALSYSAATGTYTISLPDFQTGQLVTLGVNGSYIAGSSTWQTVNGTYNAVTAGESSAQQDVRVALDWPASSSLKYTSTGSWYFLNNYLPQGYFAYGIPTAGPDMPLSGTGSYKGAIEGGADDGSYIFGSVSLAFDFAAGTLAGSMSPTLSYWDWTDYPLGDYTFRDTVFSRGSTSFSGAFTVPGSNASSAFNGRFNGPGAAELMASWNAPYTHPVSKEAGTMGGIWTAKKE